ncbi:MAG: SDR family NAD(P)-dependent oxidoreductase, partial [Devosia sp.]|nr:SDR family NAD(P)-dependent oxidoreductase [Devosia sp.]
MSANLAFNADLTRPLDMSGKVALITGAAGGIGRALATLFAANGATLALLDKNEAVHDFAAELGTGHKGWTGDVTDAATIERIVAEVAQHFGKIDILINNAGIGMLAPAEATTTASWDLQLAVNLRAPYLFSREVAGHMIAVGYGRIVTIASQAAVIGIEGHVAYSASKAGLLGMNNCMALEWGPKGITANCISPTVVETELGKVGWSGEKGERARA